MKAVSEVRVLVVEDDPFFARVLHKRLGAEGYQVQVAGDGREGMKAIVSFEPDLVISDWMMPQVDGLELCQSVKTGLREAAPYFILLTAKGEIDDKLLALETGADDYLVKPCDQGELMARVRAGLRIILLTQDLRRAASEVRTLRAEVDDLRRRVPRTGLVGLSLCPCCKRIEEGGQWAPLDQHLVARHQAEFRHAVCPTCEAPPAHGAPHAA